MESPQPYLPFILKATRESQQTAKPHLLQLQLQVETSSPAFEVGDTNVQTQVQEIKELFPFSPTAHDHLQSLSDRATVGEMPVVDGEDVEMSGDQDANDFLQQGELSIDKTKGDMLIIEQPLSETRIIDRDIPVILCHSPHSISAVGIQSPSTTLPEGHKDMLMIVRGSPTISRDSISIDAGEPLIDLDRPRSGLGDRPGEFTPSLGRLMGSAGEAVKRYRKGES